MFNRKEFLELQAACGPFALDAAASDNGLNAHTRSFCSPTDSFLKANVSGASVWGFFPPSCVSQFLTHYLQAKQTDPTTSGVFVLPCRPKAKWWPNVKSMLQVKSYPKGALIFTASPSKPEELESVPQLVPAPWPVVVLWDPPTYPQQSPSNPSGPDLPAEIGRVGGCTPPDVGSESPVAAAAADLSRKLVLLAGHCNKVPVRVLIDSGASSDFVSRTFADEHRWDLVSAPDNAWVRLADGSQRPSGHKVPGAKIIIDGFECRTDLLVTS
jgi:hypothetical protein